MILSTLNSHNTKPAVPLAVELAPIGRAQVCLQTPDQTSCRLQIDRVVREIDRPAVRGIVEAVFGDLLRLLECLSLMEGHLRQVDVAEETFAFFEIIHAEARVLVEFIREDALNCGTMDEELKDTLDGITFAVNHDLQRVFETGQQNPTAEKAPVMLGKLYRAHDLLTNCLQQSTITLAMMFDPGLVGARLFNNSDMRYRQSLQLCEDLTRLLVQIHTSEMSFDESAFDTLQASLEKFRNESLECLMYSDWPQFESFCERIKVAGTSSLQLEPVLHQFRCYIETLLGQVRMRAVLANVFPESRHLSPSSDFHQANDSWDEFAVAV